MAGSHQRFRLLLIAAATAPLHYLPYTDTANFTGPADARFNRQSNGQMAARLVFSAGSELEGDLVRVEVDLKNGPTLLATRQVSFDDDSHGTFPWGSSWTIRVAPFLGALGAAQSRNRLRDKHQRSLLVHW
jgi:hypothetical protein